MFTSAPCKSRALLLLILALIALSCGSSGSANVSEEGSIDETSLDDTSSAADGVESEREILESLYAMTAGETWVKNANWLSADGPCAGAWYGVGCSDDGQVITVHLQSNGLRGAIPDALFLLPSLKELNLGHNELAGGIPSTISQATSLSYLSLSHNKLDGSMPTDITNVPLTFLALSDNALSGSIPEEYGVHAWTSLTMASNVLHGFMPAFLVDPPEYSFDASDNLLWCPVPQWCGLKGPNPTARKCVPCVIPPHGTPIPSYLQSEEHGEQAADLDGVDVASDTTPSPEAPQANMEASTAPQSTSTSSDSSSSWLFSMSFSSVMWLLGGVVCFMLLVLLIVSAGLWVLQKRRVRQAELDGYRRLSHLSLDDDGIE